MKTAENGENKSELLVALAGNPNSGKTTIFNAITGARQHVGNYPGVTVERREGKKEHKGASLHIIDLPGTYSLSAYSPDEKVARKVLLDEAPDVVIQIIDAGNLERSLYLTTQLIALKVPLVLAFNMMDEVEKKGIQIDIEQLSTLLGVPIITTVGHRGWGMEELVDKAVEVAQAGEKPAVEVKFGLELDNSIDSIREAVTGTPLVEKYDAKWLAIKLLEEDQEVTGWMMSAEGDKALEVARDERQKVNHLMGDEPEILLADARYGWLHGAVKETVRLTRVGRQTITDKVDTVLANRVLGLPIFLLFMWVTFEITFRLGEPLMEFIESGVGWLGNGVSLVLPEGLIQSVIVDGVIAGVGGVLVFLPNIMLLFIMVSLMEDSGYMARAAFIVDKVMHRIGLHGKSFIPLFIGFGCNVPAIMGTRVLENERDRITTILVAPFISCSARLPIYILLAGAFFPAAHAGKVIFSLYILGIVVAMIMARLLRAYVVKGPPTPFVMELPPYRMPTIKSVLMHMWERAWMYLKKAGTIILAASIVVWFLTSFPGQVKHSGEVEKAISRYGSVEKLPEGMRNIAAGEKISESYAGRIGRAVSPLLKPIGLDNWKTGIALLTGFAAKEIVVSTMGTLYSLGETGEKSPDLRKALKSDPFFTPLRAYTFMVFVLLYIPCMAVVAVAYRELGSWKWTALMVLMTTSVAYIASGITWWLGNLIIL